MSDLPGLPLENPSLSLSALDEGFRPNPLRLGHIEYSFS